MHKKKASTVIQSTVRHDCHETLWSKRKIPKLPRQPWLKQDVTACVLTLCFPWIALLQKVSSLLPWKIDVPINTALLHNLYSALLQVNSHKTISSSFRSDRNTDVWDRIGSSQVLCTGLGYICLFCSPANCSLAEQHMKRWQATGEREGSVLASNCHVRAEALQGIRNLNTLTWLFILGTSAVYFSSTSQC